MPTPGELLQQIIQDAYIAQTTPAIEAGAALEAAASAATAGSFPAQNNLTSVLGGPASLSAWSDWPAWLQQSFVSGLPQVGGGLQFNTAPVSAQWQGVVGSPTTYAEGTAGAIAEYGAIGAFALGLYTPHDTPWYEEPWGEVAVFSIAAMWGVAGAVAGASVGAAVYAATPGVIGAFSLGVVSAIGVGVATAVTAEKLLPQTPGANRAARWGTAIGSAVGSGLVAYSNAEGAYDAVLGNEGLGALWNPDNYSIQLSPWVQNYGQPGYGTTGIPYGTVGSTLFTPAP